METTKVMDLIPENLREDLIKEIELILKERSEKAETPTPRQIGEVVNKIMETFKN